jgi:hypothetical protein
MTRDEAIEKIKKLLRMKRGGTAGEVENALAAAAKIAREFGISMESVNPDEAAERERITHVEDLLKSRLPAEARFAAAIVINFFNVQCLLRRSWRYSITFVGTAWDCEIARYVFVFLQGHFRRSWHRRENKRLKNRLAFLNGMFLGLAAKLEAERPHPDVENPEGKSALIRIDRANQQRKDYLARLCPQAKDSNLPEDDSDAFAAKLAGVAAGQRTNIRSGLKGQGAPQRPALPTTARLTI